MTELEQRDDTFSWRVGDRLLRRGDIPLLMGILNVTPDSFSDGGHHDTVDAAVAHAGQLLQDGADILDVGGESTRPGAEPVSQAEELRRTIPVVERICIAYPTALVSIDTTKAEVARQAVDAGASIVNDISGMTFDGAMIDVCAERGVAVCAMHILGTPQTMQQEPRYEDVVADVTRVLRQRMAALVEGGVPAERICLDPGIGFGKTAAHNLELMHAVPQMRRTLQRPLLVGHSRKRFLSKLLGRELDERAAGTIGVSIGLAENGTDILRIHDVRAVRDALLARNAVAVGANA